MRNKFLKKILVSLALLVVLGVISAGCGTTAPPVGPVAPTTYTVKIVSAHDWAYGTVYVSGVPTNSVLVAWGSTYVYNVPSGAPIWLKDAAGLESNVKYFNPLFGTTIVFDTWP